MLGHIRQLPAESHAADWPLIHTPAYSTSIVPSVAGRFTSVYCWLLWKEGWSVCRLLPRSSLAGEQ